MALKQKEAREAEAKVLVEKETNSSLTFTQVADSYFDWYTQRRKQSSINVIKNIIYNHLLKRIREIKDRSNYSKTYHELSK